MATVQLPEVLATLCPLASLLCHERLFHRNLSHQNTLVMSLPRLHHSPITIRTSMESVLSRPSSARNGPAYHASSSSCYPTPNPATNTLSHIHDDSSQPFSASQQNLSQHRSHPYPYPASTPQQPPPPATELPESFKSAADYIGPPQDLDEDTLQQGKKPVNSSRRILC